MPLFRNFDKWELWHIVFCISDNVTWLWGIWTLTIVKFETMPKNWRFTMSWLTLNSHLPFAKLFFGMLIRKRLCRYATSSWNMYVSSISTLRLVYFPNQIFWSIELHGLIRSILDSFEFVEWQTLKVFHRIRMNPFCYLYFCDFGKYIASFGGFSGKESWGQCECQLFTQ